MFVIFNLECREHKEGPVRSQIGHLAFNHLRTPFCTSILNLPSNPIHHPYYYRVQYHYLHEKKAAQNSLNFGCLLFTYTVEAYE